MGAELSTIADDLSCIECRKKRSPHAPVLVQPPRFPGSITRTQAEAALRQAKDLQKRSDEQTRKTCAAMARNESATDFGCQRLREHMRAERERREKGEGGDEDGGGVVEGDEDGDGISEHFVPTAGDAFIGGVDQAIAGVDSVVDEAFDSGFIDLLGR